MPEITESVTGPTGDDQAEAADASAAVTMSRQTIPVSELVAHPGNVREDLNLTAEFTASIAAEGIRVPLLVTTAPDGGWRVIEGHRRLAAAAQAGLAEVPCDIDPARADDEAGQYLDMALANSDSYRVNYQPAEEAAALFAAHEAGASRTRIRKATGRTAAQVKIALAAGGLPAETRMLAIQRNSEITLEDLALLAEFDSDEQATETLLSCLDRGWPLEHAAERIRQANADKAERDELRKSLLEAGVPLTERLPEGATWLSVLTHDGHDLTPETHASCPGHGAAFADWNPLHPQFYCTSAADYGHENRWASSTVTRGSGDDNDTSDTIGADPSSTAGPDPTPDPSRRLVIAGNKAWEAATHLRHRWLTGSLFARRSLPREAQAFAARQYLAMPDPLRGGLVHSRRSPLFAKLTGHDPQRLDRECDTAPAGRLTVIMLAPIVTAYEQAMTEGRNTWRTDRYSPCPRRDAGAYLAFLGSLGYQVSGIEQAVIDGGSWTGDEPAEAIFSAGHPKASDGSDNDPVTPDTDADQADDPIAAAGKPIAADAA